MAAPHEPLGEQPRDELDGSGAGRRKRRGDGCDLRDAERPHTRVLEQRREHASRLEVLLRDLARPGRVMCVVGVDARHGLDGLVRRREGQQPFARGQMTRPRRVLHDGRAPGREIAFGPVAEPAAPRRDVGVLGDAELPARRLDEVAVVLGRAGDLHRRQRRPAVRLEQLLRTVDRELEARPVRAGRSMKRRNSTSLLPPTSVKLSIVQLMTDVKRSRCGAASVRQSEVTTGCQVFCHVNSPVGTAQPSRADVGAEREQPIEAAEEVRRTSPRSSRWRAA